MKSIFTTNVTTEKLVELGFVEHGTGTQDVCWTYETANFSLFVCCFGEMKIARKFPDAMDSDLITLYCEDLSDVHSVLDWIAN